MDSTADPTIAGAGRDQMVSCLRLAQEELASERESLDATAHQRRLETRKPTTNVEKVRAAERRYVEVPTYTPS